MGSGIVHSKSYYHPAPQFLMHNAYASVAAAIGTDGLNDSGMSYDYTQLEKLIFMGPYASVAAAIGTDGLNNPIAFLASTPVAAAVVGALGIIIFFANDTHASVSAAIPTDGLHDLIILITTKSFAAAVIGAAGIKRYFIFTNIVRGSTVHMMVFQVMNFTPLPSSPHMHFIFAIFLATCNLN